MHRLLPRTEVQAGMQLGPQSSFAAIALADTAHFAGLADTAADISPWHGQNSHHLPDVLVDLHLAVALHLWRPAADAGLHYYSGHHRPCPLLTRPAHFGRVSCCRHTYQLCRHSYEPLPTFWQLPDHTPGSACPGGQRSHFRHAGRWDAGTRPGLSTSRRHLPPTLRIGMPRHLGLPS
jgi:hypothetical protein